MSMNLITGYAGTAHITAEGDGAVNAGMYGNGKYVLNILEKFAYEIISNNLIRIKSGYAINQGRKIELAVSDYEELEIDNGLQGVKRCDLISIHYSKNMTTGIETATLEVIKGTSGDDYTDPSYTTGDIINRANEDDFLLYRVKINGLSIEEVEPLFSVTDSIINLLGKKDLEIAELNSKIDSQNKTLTTLNTNLDKKVNTSDVVNNLTSTSTTKPLSAAQGKAINDKMTYQVVVDSSDVHNRNKLVYDKATGLHIFSYTRRTSVANGTTVATIPSGHRPSADVDAEALCKHDTSGIGIGRLTVKPDGSVVLASTEFNEPLKGSFTIVW